MSPSTSDGVTVSRRQSKSHHLQVVSLCVPFGVLPKFT